MFEKDEIIEYYDEAEIAYRDVWHLNDCLAMHYGFWEEGVKTLKEALIKENFVLANIARISQNDLVLDAGCGVGGSSIFLAKNFGCRVKGVSLSENQCEQAKQNASKANVSKLAKFEAIDYHSSNYPKNSFTVIWAIETLGYSYDLDLFFNEAFRILKPGGRIIIADGFANKETFSKPEQKIMDKWLHNWAISKISTIDQYEQLLVKNGFTRIEIIDKTKAIKKSAKIMSRWSNLALYYAKFLKFFGIKYGNATSIRNTIGGKFQNIALRKQLWNYSIIYAEKPKLQD